MYDLLGGTEGRAELDKVAWRLRPWYRFFLALALIGVCCGIVLEKYVLALPTFVYYVLWFFLGVLAICLVIACLAKGMLVYVEIPGADGGPKPQLYFFEGVRAANVRGLSLSNEVTHALVFDLRSRTVFRAMHTQGILMLDQGFPYRFYLSPNGTVHLGMFKILFLRPRSWQAITFSQLLFWFHQTSSGDLMRTNTLFSQAINEKMTAESLARHMRQLDASIRKTNASITNLQMEASVDQVTRRVLVVRLIGATIGLMVRGDQNASAQQAVRMYLATTLEGLVKKTLDVDLSWLLRELKRPNPGPKQFYREMALNLAGAEHGAAMAYLRLMTSWVADGMQGSPPDVPEISASSARTV